MSLPIGSAEISGRPLVRLFGPLEVEIAGRRLGPRDLGSKKAKQLLEILLIERGHVVSKDRLADLLWGEMLPKNVSGTIETYVSVLRRRLHEHLGTAGAHPLIVTDHGGYRVLADAADVDLDRFDGLMKAGDRPSLEQALELVRGEVLEDEPYAEWALRLRDVYGERHVRLLLDLADLELADGDDERALAHAEAVIALDPVRERSYRTAMLACYALGRQDEALRQFDRCSRTLAQELGVDPLPETMTVREAILRQIDPAALIPGRPQSQAVVPGRQARVPFLGRADALAALNEAVSSARALEQPTTIVVSGEAGIGKTRLLEEFLDRLKGFRKACTKCFALDRDVPFLPLTDIVRQLTAGGAAPPDAPGLSVLLPELGPSGLGPGEARRLALEALVSVGRAAAPVVLVVDDAHWADESTIAALGYLHRRCAAAPVAVVVSVRTGDAPADHPVWTLQADTRIALGPLSVEEVGHVGAGGIFERSGGNPLFLVELLRAKDEGQLDVIPDSLQEAIQARCRSAGPEAHRLLVAASVLGRVFEPQILAEMVGSDATEVAERLEALSERRLLRVAGEGFDFFHDLVRDAVLAALSPPRRRALHGRALEALERAGAEPAQLAAQAEAAGRLEVAIRYSVAAGDRARSEWANAEGVTHYARARRLAQGHPDLLEPASVEEILLRLARALVTVGRVDEACKAATEALQSSESRGDERALFEALDALVAIRHLGFAEAGGVLRLAGRAFDIAERLGDDRLMARAQTWLGSARIQLGELDEGIDQCRSALARAERTAAGRSAYVLGRLASGLRFRGEEHDAIRTSVEAEQAALRERDEEALIMARWIRALALSATGQYRRAWSTLDSISTVGHNEVVFWSARVLNSYGSLLHDLCLPERALERDLESLEAVRSSRWRAGQEAAVQSRLNLADDHLARGAITEARAELEHVRAQVDDVEVARFRWLNRYHYLDAEVSAAEERPDSAYQGAETCLCMAARYGQAKYEVRGHLARGSALRLLGEREQAIKEMRRAGGLAEARDYHGLAWRAWWRAYQLSGETADLRLATRRVGTVAGDLDEALQEPFLRAVPVKP